MPVRTRDHNHDDAPLKSLYMYDKAHAITASTARLGRMDPFIVLKRSLKFQFRLSDFDSCQMTLISWS